MEFTNVGHTNRARRVVTYTAPRSATEIARALIGVATVGLIASGAAVARETARSFYLWVIAGVSPVHLRRGHDRGDVPGWVLITLMTAGLVVALWAIAGPMLADLFTDAVSNVKGP